MRKIRDDKWIKKLTKHVPFYHDVAFSGYRFYAKLNDLYDISILIYHPDEVTVREFIMDSPSFIAAYEFSQDENFSVHKRFTKPGARPSAVRPLIEDDGYKLIKVGESKLVKAYTVAKMVEYQGGEYRVKALDLKRIITRPGKGSPLIGTDTMTLPLEAAKELVKTVKDLFKGHNIEIDLEEMLHGEDYDNGRYKQ
jgi:hypothetical protein